MSTSRTAVVGTRLGEQSQQKVHRLHSDSERKLLDEGIGAVEAGDEELGRELLWEVLRLNPNNEQGWLWRMSLSRTKSELIENGRQVLRINPRNEQVIEWLEKFCRKEGIPMPTPAANIPGELAPMVRQQAVSLTSHEDRRSGPHLRSSPTTSTKTAPRREAVGEPISPIHANEPVLPKDGESRRPRPVPSRDPVREPTAPPPPARPAAASKAWLCPLCRQASEKQGIRCRKCGAVVELKDLRAIGRTADVNERELIKALARLEQEAEARPTAPAHMRLATVHLNLNDSGAALEQLAQALRLSPDDTVLKDHYSFLKTQRIVLVIDTDEKVARDAAAILEPYRLRVRTAHNGLQAISQVEEEMPDLILLNMELPRMDGFEVCKILRKNAAAKNLPIIMMQDEGHMIGKLRGRLAGVAGFVTKPLTSNVLRDLLKKHLPDSYLPDPEMARDSPLKL